MGNNKIPEGAEFAYIRKADGSIECFTCHYCGYYGEDELHFTEYFYHPRKDPTTTRLHRHVCKKCYILHYTLYEMLAGMCVSEEMCPMNYNLYSQNCPFDKKCVNITADDWKGK